MFNLFTEKISSTKYVLGLMQHQVPNRGLGDVRGSSSRKLEICIYSSSRLLLYFSMGIVYRVAHDSKSKRQYRISMLSHSKCFSCPNATPNHVQSIAMALKWVLALKQLFHECASLPHASGPKYRATLSSV